MSKPELIFEGKHFKVFHEQVDVGDGEAARYEYVWRTDGARVVATHDGQILITREFRQELDDYDWRLPGGKVDEGETPLDAARRELREETGVSASSWRFLWSSTPDATVRYRRHFFLATDLTIGESSQDAGEQITTHWVSIAEACALALRGEMREEISALALLRLQHQNLLG